MEAAVYQERVGRLVGTIRAKCSLGFLFYWVLWGQHEVDKLYLLFST